MIESTKGVHITAQSNPDIAIVNTHEASVYINTRYWSGFSDYRPVTYSIKYILKINEVILRVVKSLFLSPASVEVAKNY